MLVATSMLAVRLDAQGPRGDGDKGKKKQQGRAAMPGKPIPGAMGQVQNPQQLAQLMIANFDADGDGALNQVELELAMTAVMQRMQQLQRTQQMQQMQLRQRAARGGMGGGMGAMPGAGKGQMNNRAKQRAGNRGGGKRGKGR
jgi:hypothetical protein